MTDSQRAALAAWLKRQRTKKARWFEDRESGASLQRDAFQKLQAVIFAGQIDTVVVWKLDRLARSLKDWSSGATNQKKACLISGEHYTWTSAPYARLGEAILCRVQVPRIEVERVRRVPSRGHCVSHSCRRGLAGF